MGLVFEMRPTQRESFLDVLVQLLDSPIRKPPHASPDFSGGDTALRRHISWLYAQLPWAVQTALIRSLYDSTPELFNIEPKDKWGTADYVDANNELADAGFYYHGDSGMVEWDFSDEYYQISAGLRAAGQTASPPQRLERWMRKHGLYETADDNPDPHFAERALLVNVLVPAAGLEVLSRLTPQKEFPEESYTVDFHLDTPGGPVLIEVDGREYHDPVKTGAERFEYELKRQNYLQSRGCPIFRYPARRILREPASVVEEIRSNLSLDFPVQSSLFSTEGAPDSALRDLVSYAEAFCKWFRPLQLALLLEIEITGVTSCLVIRERVAPPGLLLCAARDLGWLIATAQELYGVQFELPDRLVLACNAPRPPDLCEVAQELSESGPDQLKNRLPYAIELVGSDSEEAKNEDLIVDYHAEGRIPLVPGGEGTDVVGRESAALGTIRARVRALSLDPEKGPNKLMPLNCNKRTLDYFARRYLRIPYLYHHYDPERPGTEERQFELVRRAVLGKSLFGIMRTGVGKSVAFQLPALLRPGGGLVVSPLRALMRDQLEDLRDERGVNSVAAVRYGMTPTAKEEAIDGFLRGRVNLLYVSPERLQEMKFANRVAQAAAKVHASFVAVDEAHCVSEWGHDFRLSYMHIRDFVDKLEEMQGDVDCPIFALTGTASPPVQRDVCNILGLENQDVREGGDLIAEANINRRELSLSVHIVTGGDYRTDRQDVLERVLTEALPAALEKQHGFDWREFSGGAWRGKGAGVVFCIYKNPKGQTSWMDGVGAVRDFVVHNDILPPDQVRLYAASEPEFCPECLKEGEYTYTIRRLRSQEKQEEGAEFQCQYGHVFNRPATEHDWERYQGDTQYSFKANQFPLLISTKAYGMGIDHRGLRFIVHYGMPSSLEAYYQEIG
ncbi:MAG: DEAD/DEAH box helicase, partial [Planctomycetes bacterium]|nr:DEAD/DEAH box helicase [Planctomycetota bacterium]